MFRVIDKRRQPRPLDDPVHLFHVFLKQNNLIAVQPDTVLNKQA